MHIFRSIGAAYCGVPAGQYEAAVSIDFSGAALVATGSLDCLAKFRKFSHQSAEGRGPGLYNRSDRRIGRGNLLIAQNFGAYGIEIYLACMLIYWVMTILIEQSFGWFERRLSKGRRPMQQKQSQRAGRSKLPAWLKRGDDANGAQY